MKYTILSVVVCIPLLVKAQDEVVQYADSAFVSAVSDTITYQNHFFEDTTMLHIILRYDISAFIKQKAKQEERYFPAELVIYMSETDSITKNIRVKARGNFRKNHCYFPPIHLSFKTDKINVEGFDEVNKIKMVTHCKSSNVYEQYVLKEYLAYRFYNLLTDNSLKVRLLRIKYEDTGKRKNHFEKYGFLIEPTKMLAQRKNCVEIEMKGFKPHNFLRTDLDRIALFNYMIGNTDWKLSAGHNLKFFKMNDPFIRELNVVPYDFDYAGLVNTEYAIPQEWSVVKTVVERDYLGYCWDNHTELLELIEEFKEKQSGIMGEIQEFNYLSERERKIVESYMLDFYREINHIKSFIRMVEGACESLN